MKPPLLIIVSPPGGGKGTQAELLAKKFGLAHLETSKIIEDRFKAADANDQVIQEEKKKWLEGELVSPQRVSQWFSGKFTELAEAGKGLVLSGSPRTVYEVESYLPLFEKYFGRDQTKVFHLSLSETESIKRNSGRRICQASRHPIPNLPENQNITVCPEDGSPIIKRELDKPEIIKERYRVYREETKPVLGYFKDHGYPVIEINGEQPIDKVFEDILENFEK